MVGGGGLLRTTWLALVGQRVLFGKGGMTMTVVLLKGGGSLYAISSVMGWLDGLLFRPNHDVMQSASERSEATLRAQARGAEEQ